MRKEVLFAIIIGIILGGVIIYGLQLANQPRLAGLAPTPTPLVGDAGLTPTPPLSAITITSPEDHGVVTSASVKITGKAAANSTIALYGEADESLTSADAGGNFSADLGLAGGDNLIKIEALSPDGKTNATEITLIYTTAKID